MHVELVTGRGAAVSGSPNDTGSSSAGSTSRTGRLSWLADERLRAWRHTREHSDDVSEIRDWT